ncbi:MAG: helix-turn-helix domain-containing protein [Candidatus Thorarchaeota archaeon]
MEVFKKHIKDFERIDDILDKKDNYSSEKILDNKGIFSSEKLFKCILGLNKTESKVFGYLLKNHNASTSEIASKLNMERSSIQRAVQDLSKLHLIHRKAISMKEYTDDMSRTGSKKQGYLYVYNAKNMEAIKAQFKQLLDKWYNSMITYIESLENLCECCGFKFEPC